jgi:hypothetical protein
MTLQEYLSGQAAGDEGIEALLREMSGFQERTALRIAQILSDLDISAGRIVASEANIARLSEVMGLVESGFADPRWQRAVRDYLGTFDVLGANTVAYLGTLGTVDGALLTALRQQYKLLAADYLLTAQSFARSLLNPIAQEVGTFIATGGRYSELVASVSNIVTGGENADGAILGNARTAVNDLVSVYERTATQVASEQVGAEFFLYQGRPIKTSRPFCVSRAGKYWHKREIESWADEDWQGKTEGTNDRTIFSFLGGYNCRHVLVPVSRQRVPADDLARMRSKGLID